MTAKALAKLFDDKAKSYHKAFAAVQGQNTELQQGWETFCNDGHTIDGYLKLRETYSELEVLIDVYKKAAEDYLTADPSKKEDVQAKVMAELDSVNSLFKEAYSSTNAARVEIRKKKTDLSGAMQAAMGNLSVADTSVGLQPTATNTTVSWSSGQTPLLSSGAGPSAVPSQTTSKAPSKGSKSKSSNTSVSSATRHRIEEEKALLELERIRHLADLDMQEHEEEVQRRQREQDEENERRQREHEEEARRLLRKRQRDEFNAVQNLKIARMARTAVEAEINEQYLGSDDEPLEGEFDDDYNDTANWNNGTSDLRSRIDGEFIPISIATTASPLAPPTVPTATISTPYVPQL